MFLCVLTGARLIFLTAGIGKEYLAELIIFVLQEIKSFEDAEKRRKLEMLDQFCAMWRKLEFSLA